MMTEDQLIERVRRAIGSPPRRKSEGLVLGMGDDAAIFRPVGPYDWVLSSDFSLEDIHFLASYPPEAVGFRALVRAASDLGAMGAHPAFFLLSLSLPNARTGRWMDRMLAGMVRASRRYGLRLIGGDTTRWPKMALAITVVGRVARGRAVRRDGAQIGDRLYVSGRLGAAALGLTIALRQRRARRGGALSNAIYRRLIRPHLYPSIPVELGIHLAEDRLASAMIDLSDGLSTDLTRLARASGVGARVFLDRLPAVPVPAALSRARINGMKLALDGGEDYGLLFTVPAGKVAQVPHRFRGIPVTCIGEIVPGREVKVVGSDGRSRPLPAAGWDPFRRSR